MFEAVKTVLPAGLWYQIREVWHLAEGMDRYTADGLAAGIRRAIPVLDTLFAAGGTAELTDIEAVCGPGAGTVLRALQKAGIAACETEARRKIGDRSRRMAELAVSAEEALALTEKRSSPARREAVRLLAAEGRMSAADVCYFTGISMASLRGLEKAGIVAFSEEEELRLPDLSDAEPAGAHRPQRRAGGGLPVHPGPDGDGKAGGGSAPGRHRQRKNGGLSAAGPGHTGPRKAGHRPGAGDRADSPDDAAFCRLLRGGGGHAPQRPADDGAL